MKRKWLFGVALVILLIMVSGIGLAEDTLTVEVPTEVQFGANIPFSAHVTREEGQIRCELFDPDLNDTDYEESEVDSSLTYESSLSYSWLIDQGMQPGAKTICFTWYSDDDVVLATVSQDILLTGTPVAKPTLTVKNTSGKVTSEFAAGASIKLSGSAGAADEIHVYIDPLYGDDYGEEIQKTATVNQAGNWSCTVSHAELDQNTNCYLIHVEGYANNRELYCGRSVEAKVFFVDNSSGVPVPGVTIEKDEEYNEWTITVTVPDQATCDGGYCEILDEDGNIVYRWGVYFDDEENVWEELCCPEYIGTYRVRVYCHKTTEVLNEDNESISKYSCSKPVEVSFAVTEGRHKPIYGKVPLMEIPGTVLAGGELNLHWVPAYPDSYMEVSVWDEDGYEIYYDSAEYNYTFTIIFPEPGEYTIKQYSYADYYQDTKSYSALTVLNNPDRPEPPTLELVDEKVYRNIPFYVSLGQGQAYEDVECRLTGESEGNGSFWVGIDTELDGDYAQVVIYDWDWEEDEEPEKGTLYVKVKKDGFWSDEASLEIDFDELPEVDEITFVDFPETVQRGEKLPVIALMPGNEGEVRTEFLDSGMNAFIWTTDDLDSNVFSRVWQGDLFISKYHPEGTYYVRLIWEGQEAVKSFVLVGECPETPTIDPIPANLKAGNSVTLTGQVGSAKQIEVEFQWENNKRYDSFSTFAAIETDGTWSLELRNLKTGKYFVSIYGRDGKLSTGNTYSYIFVADENSLPKPTVTIKAGEYNEVVLTLKPGTNLTGKEVYWAVSRTDEHGGNWTNTYYGQAGGLTFTNWLDSYENTYTYTVAYSADGTYSAPAQVTWHVEGPPYPVNGRIPLNLEVPETWEAGTDLVIPWTPVAEGQYWSISLYDGASNEFIWGDSGYTASLAETTFVIDGAQLDEGSYWIEFYSEADTYEYARSTYSFSVTDSRPEGPEVTLSAESGIRGECIYATVTTQDPGILAVQTGGSISRYRVQGGSTRIPIVLNSTGDRVYKFRLKTENGWTRATVKTISVELGKEIPEIDYSKLVTWPAKISAGQDAAITVKNIPGVDYYSVVVSGPGFYHSDRFTGTKYTIPGVFFKAGDTVEVIVRAYADGLDEAIGGWENRASKSYKVASGTSSASTLKISTVNTVTYYQNSTIPITLDKTASKVILMYRMRNDSMWYTYQTWESGKWKNLNVRLWETGTPQIRITALVNGQWTKWSNVLTVTVSPTTGKLESPEATAIQIRDKLHVSWDAVDHAETYYAYLYMVSTGRWFVNEISDGTTQCDFQISDIGEGDGYVYVEGTAPGYQADVSNLILTLFTIKPAYPPEDGLQLPGELEVIETNAFSGIRAETIVVPYACTRIMNNAFAGNEALKEVWILNSDTVVESDAFEGCTDVVVWTYEGSKAVESLTGQPNITFEFIP